MQLHAMIMLICNELRYLFDYCTGYRLVLQFYYNEFSVCNEFSKTALYDVCDDDHHDQITQHIIAVYYSSIALQYSIAVQNYSIVRYSGILLQHSIPVHYCTLLFQFNIET